METKHILKPNIVGLTGRIYQFHFYSKSKTYLPQFAEFPLSKTNSKALGQL